MYSKELKGAISAVASLQGQLLIASGPKIILHKWSGAELNGVAFYDAPPLHVVSLNVVSVTFVQATLFQSGLIVAVKNCHCRRDRTSLAIPDDCAGLYLRCFACPLLKINLA